MKTIKQVQEANGKKSPAMALKECCIESNDDLIDLFPQPRYFQVHFQHIHENTHCLQDELMQLKNYIARVDEKLERLMTLLGRSGDRMS